MQTIKLYKITCTAGQRGESFSLEPWAPTATKYEGYDDGGKDYILPDGYEVAAYQNQPGNGIFHGYNHCEIRMHYLSGLPQLINNKSFTPVDGWTVLELVP